MKRKQNGGLTLPRKSISSLRTEKKSIKKKRNPKITDNACRREAISTWSLSLDIEGKALSMRAAIYESAMPFRGIRMSEALWINIIHSNATATENKKKKRIFLRKGRGSHCEIYPRGR